MYINYNICFLFSVNSRLKNMNLYKKFDIIKSLYQFFLKSILKLILKYFS